MPDFAEIVGDRLLSAYPPVDEGRLFDPTIHVSNLIEFCPREFWLCFNNGRSYHQRKYLGVRSGWDFDLGHAIQNLQADRLAQVGAVYGTWKCLHCGRKEMRYYRPGVRCSKCKARAFKHVDTTLIKEVGVLMVTGNVDYFVVVRLNPVLLTIVDSKSIGIDYFDKLSAPGVSYRRQCQLYMNMVEQGAVPPPDVAIVDPLPEVSLEQAVISYAVKGSRPMPFKHYEVIQDRPFVEDINGKLLALSENVVANTEPPKICGSVYDLMAKRCAIRDVCFGFNPEQEVEQPEGEPIAIQPKAKNRTRIVTKERAK